MLITFFDKQVVIYKEFVHEEQRVNSAFYTEVIEMLLKRISQARPQFQTEGSWCLLHDNAPSHPTLVLKHIFGQTQCCGDKPSTLFSCSRTSKFFSLSTSK
jgi:hypothetical protein